MRVLIVDDEWLIRESLNRVAQARGHETRVENSGKKGLKAWREFQPHLVFLDVLMPELDGPSVLQLNGKKNNEKVVLMSAHRVFSSIPHKGVDLFVSKPFQDIMQIFCQAENLCLSQIQPQDQPSLENMVL